MCMPPRLLLPVVCWVCFTDSWVLYSPTERGNLGLGYSLTPLSDDLSNDWPGSGVSLNEMVLRWGADSVGGLALHKTITYAIHPDFCTHILPQFPEGGRGSIDGMVTFLNCWDLHAAVSAAFNTWQANSKHIKFTDVSQECSAPDAIVEDRCGRAEILIDARDLSAHGVAALFFPTLTISGSDVTDRSPKLTSGTQLHAGIGIRSGRIVMSTGICWYLDSTLCAAATLLTIHASNPVPCHCSPLLQQMYCCACRCPLAAVTSSTRWPRGTWD